jgi:hypothetical protein
MPGASRSLLKRTSALSVADPVPPQNLKHQNLAGPRLPRTATPVTTTAKQAEDAIETTTTPAVAVAIAVVVAEALAKMASRKFPMMTC